MRFSRFIGMLLASGQATGLPSAHGQSGAGSKKTIAPKVMFVNFFSYEADTVYSYFPTIGLNILAVNVTVPGLSMLYPEVHCTEDRTICQVTTGESEINAASTTMALLLSDKFDLTKTYFLLGGIAGVNPQRATIGSVALSQYAVSVSLQYEIDAREMPSNFSTGYFGFGTYGPGEYPKNIYGTEVLELNKDLMDVVLGFASKANLSAPVESTLAYDALYTGEEFEPARQPPSVLKCDTATSDNYYSGALLSGAYDSWMKLLTNGSAEYCMTAQEDTAVLEALLRGTLFGRVDYSRAILMRSGSDFDRQSPSQSVYQALRFGSSGGGAIATANVARVGGEIVKGIVDGWDCTFNRGIKATNYIGDILGSLGGQPDFGPGSVFGGHGAPRSD